MRADIFLEEIVKIDGALAVKGTMLLILFLLFVREMVVHLRILFGGMGCPEIECWTFWQYDSLDPTSPPILPLD